MLAAPKPSRIQDRYRQLFKGDSHRTLRADKIDQKLMVVIPTSGFWHTYEGVPNTLQPLRALIPLLAQGEYILPTLVALTHHLL